MSTPFNQKIRDTFTIYANGEKLYRKNLELALNALNIRITFGEIDQIMCAACETNPRFSSDFVTFSEFALVVMEITTHKRNEKSTPAKQRLQQIITAPGDKKFDVFLGGSCNPTTWRKDTAIPHLEAQGVTYYNPQVDDWYPELIEIEEKAKRNSTIKLFVFDSETRALASLVETAFMASIGWRLVVVLHYLPESSEVKIAGETLSKLEVKDLNRGRSFLCDILEKLGVPVFDNLEGALECTCDVIHGRVSYARMLGERKRAVYQYGSWLVELRKLFNKQNPMCRELTPNDESPIVEVSGIKPQVALIALQEFLQSSTLPSSTRMGIKYLELINCKITFDMFCLLTAEAVYQINNSLWSWGVSLLTNFIQYTSAALKTPTVETQMDTVYNVFLGGSCGETTWREDTAIPLLKANSLTYYNPQVDTDQWNIRKISEESSIKEISKFMLFVIAKDSPSIASMTEAAFLIGSGNNLHLVIEDLEITENQIPYEMTAQSQKDNKRARSYIRDTARGNKVPVFATVNEAISAILLGNK